MPYLSNRSINRLEGVHQDLITVLHYAIKFVDFTVLYGVRTAEEQFSLYKKGRTKVGGVWTITNEKKVVTYKDGYDKISKHQTGDAVDIVFYHSSRPYIVWDDHKANYYLVGYALGIARMLKSYGAIESEIVSGANWDNDADIDDQSFFDVFHLELI